MADDLRMALAELLRKAQGERDVDFLREGVRVLSQALMELEVAQHVGAARYERAAERTAQRNGYRERLWDTRVGTVELRVPRVRDGSCFPSLLDPRKRAERALVAAVQEAYVQGVSTRRVHRNPLRQQSQGTHVPGSPPSRIRQEPGCAPQQAARRFRASALRSRGGQMQSRGRLGRAQSIAMTKILWNSPSPHNRCRI